MGIVRDIITRFRFRVENGKLKATTRATRAAERRMSAAARQARALRNELLSMGNAAKMAVGGWLGLNLLQGAVQGVGLGIIQANAEFERLNAMLLTVTGSADKTNAAFAQITEFASSTPYQIDQVTRAFIGLTRKGLDTSNEAMTSMGDLASISGSNIEELMDGMINVVDRANDRILQGITGMNFSLQGDKILVSQLDGTTVAIERSHQALQNYLIEAGKMPGIAGGMARQMDTLGGRWSNFKDALFQLYVAIGKAGLNDALKALTGQLIKLTKRLQRFASDGDKMRRVMEGAKKVAKGLAAAMATVVAKKGLLGLMKLTKIIRSFGTAAMWANIKLMLIPAAFLAILLIIEDLVGFVQGKDSLFGRFLERSGIDPEPVRASLRKAGDAFFTVWERLKEAGGKISETWSALWERMGIDADDAGLYLAAGVVGFAEGIAGTIEILINGFSMLGTWIGQGLAEAWLRLVVFDEWVRGLFWKITRGVYNAWVWLKKGIIGLFTGIRDFFSGIFDAAIEAVKDILRGLPDFIIEELPSEVKSWIGMTSLAEKAKGYMPSSEQKVVDTFAAPAEREERLANSTRSVSVGELAVNVQGSADMSAPEMQAAVSEGVRQEMKRLIEADFNDVAEVAP